VSAPRDATRRRYAPLKDKTLHACLAHRIGQEFPRIGGPRILQLCADMIIEEIGRHLQPAAFVKHGQVLWLAVDINDPPGRAKRIADTRLVPTVPGLFLPEDADAVIERVPAPERRARRSVSLCQQAHQQGGLLSNADLAMLLSIDDSRVAETLTAYETKTGKLVPRRATLHDMGSGLTHKAVICRLRYREGKTSDVIARETHHSIEAVDRYFVQYDRVRHCRQLGMSRQQTAYILKCSEGLVQQYLDIDQELSASGGGGQEASS